MRHSAFSRCIYLVIRFNLFSMCGVLWLFLKSIEMHLQRRNIHVFNTEFSLCCCSCVQQVLRWFFSLLSSCWSVYPSKPSVFSTSVFIDFTLDRCCLASLFPPLQHLFLMLWIPPHTHLNMIATCLCIFHRLRTQLRFTLWIRLHWLYFCTVKQLQREI